MDSAQPLFTDRPSALTTPPLPLNPEPTVLVVDDELRSQEAIRRTLEEDFRVLTAGSAEQASALLER